MAKKARPGGVTPGRWNADGPDDWSTIEVEKGTVSAAAQFLARSLGALPKLRATTPCAGGQIVEYAAAGPSLSVRVSVFAVEGWSEDLVLHAARLACDRAKDTLCFFVVPQADCELLSIVRRQTDQPSLLAAVQVIFPSDIYAVGRGDFTAAELYEYKLFRRFTKPGTDAETQFASTLVSQFRRAVGQATTISASGEVGQEGGLADAPAGFVEHPLLDDIVTSLDRNRACLLIGESSSGKSVLSKQIAEREGPRDVSIHRLNLSRMNDFVTGLSSLLLSEESPQRHLFIVDDLQSNPTLAHYLVAVISLWRRVAIGSRPGLLAICWPDFGHTAAEWLEDSKPFSVFPKQVRDRLARTYEGCIKSDTLAAILERYGEDLYLLGLALNRAQEIHSAPSSEDLAEGIWNARVQGVGAEAATRAGLIASSLGRYDISIPEGFLRQEALIDQVAVDHLVDRGLLRKAGATLSIGHRSLAALLNEWLLSTRPWPFLQGPFSVTGIVLDYLKASNASTAIDTLRGLQARAGFKQEKQLNVRAATVVEVWRAFSAIVERLEEQQRHDPTWGAAPSSAMFAATAFSEIGNDRLVEASLAYLRSAWTLDDRVRIDLASLATKDDFVEIRKAMEEEDAVSQSPQTLGDRAAVAVDMERFHHTWALGVILCSEAVALSPRYELDRIAKAAVAEQLKRGAFYPERVPWCTARVLLGLAACGHSVQTSEAVRLAVAWLLRDQSQGGPMVAGVWPSGTGRWNSTLECTGMVLLALGAVGFDTSDERLQAAKAFLISQRSQWTVPGSELDGALSIQAFLDTGGRWDQIAEDAQRLSLWARGEAVWQGAGRSSKDSLEQSCRAAQIASHLVKIGWQAVRSDLPAFLDALAGPAASSARSSPPLSGEPLVIKARGVELPDPLISILAEADSLSLAEATVVGEYRRFDEVIRNELKDRVIQMRSALEVHSESRQNFLIWAAPGSGKSFLIQELARELGDTITYYEVNFANDSREDILAACKKISADKKPTLVLFDEADARPDEGWLYENTFSLLDKGMNGDTAAVFVLIGSKSVSINNMIQEIRTRPKGTDLIDRIPADNRFEIPKMTLGDKVVVMVSQAMAAAKRRGVELTEIEKFALYYPLYNSDTYNSPRQFRELFQAAVGQIGAGDKRLNYDDLFRRGDRHNQEFYAAHSEPAKTFGRHYLRVSET